MELFFNGKTDDLKSMSFCLAGPLYRGAGERGGPLQDQDPLLLPRPVQGHQASAHREELPHLLPGSIPRK